MDVITTWTGALASMLRAAWRMTIEEFADKLGLSARTIAKWEADPAFTPPPSMQQILDTALEQATSEVRTRFRLLRDAAGAADDSEFRLSRNLDVAASLEWLDCNAGWPPGAARRKAAAHLSALNLRELQDLDQRRGRVSREQVATAVRAYYGPEFGEHRLYQASCPGGALKTSILTCPEWLPKEPRHGSMGQSVALADSPCPVAQLDQVVADAAAQRLAEVVATGARLVNAPLYQLLTLSAAGGDLEATVGITEFANYALTMDLLENELLDAVSDKRECRAGRLALRDRLLPDVAAVLGFGDRLCAGGPLALCAIARGVGHARRGCGDYLLLIQERSSSVLNATRRLAVVPKAFHQPMSDPRGDAPLAATLERELEEELFGRDDVDSALHVQRHAHPMHPNLLSEPMRWLAGNADRERWHTEWTGFGINLVSGNFEFASLIVIEDEEWWDRFGGDVQVNWESSGLRCYSSLDHGFLASLVSDPAWSNEGLFALLQGLRQLAACGGSRVNLPDINLEV